MHRCLFCAVVALVSLPESLPADSFDTYVNPLLAKVPTADGVKEIKQLTFSEMS